MCLKLKDYMGFTGMEWRNFLNSSYVIQRVSGNFFKFRNYLLTLDVSRLSGGWGRFLPGVNTHNIFSKCSPNVPREFLQALIAAAEIVGIDLSTGQNRRKK